MEAPAKIPPIIETPRRSFTPVFCFAFVAAAVAGALLSSHLNVQFLRCTFKDVTGIPCAFCGSTRALREMGHFHFGSAFWLNPLVTLTAVAAAACAILSAASPPLLDRIIYRVKRLPLLLIGFALVGLNWLFVLKFLPR